MTEMILASISPAILIVLYYFVRDSFQEPFRIVFITFVLSFLSVIPIVIVNIFLDNYGNTLQISDFSLLLYTNLFRAGFHEELYKFLILVYFCSRHTQFNEPMDAVVYGVAASLGFSAFENIEYVLSHNDFGMTWDAMATIRIIPTLMHGINGIIMGLLLSRVLFGKSDHKRLIFAFLIPVFIHGFYNQMFYYQEIVSYLILIVAIIYGTRQVGKLRAAQLNKFEEDQYKENVNGKIVLESIFFTLVFVGITIYLSSLFL
tara:strand:- start:1500 stop:2279 length:780 start_codon:yes stop_codon:yes gene_type:complete